MAAAAERHAPEVVELTRISAALLDPILDEERIAWRSTLNWDFSASADLVRRFVGIQALNGYALVSEGTPVGYAYYVSEDRKGLIGDIYILRDFATPENEDALISAVLQSLVRTLGIGRIEAQLMMLRGPFERALPFARYAQIFPRLFMLVDLEDAARLPDRSVKGVRVEEWDESRREEAATLIASAYHHHIDSSINDQYRSYAGAKRFLNNVVNYPGCGSFTDLASLAAYDSDGEMIGIILSSLVASDVGHITQVCIAPANQGRGLGYEVVRQALMALKSAGCEKASLTVTAANANAVRLYQSMGFRAVRRFAAYVWEGF
jgi:ribosomal protein S18 acetylase RimI-like enzyme